MKWAEWAMTGLLLWTLLGLAGTALSLLRREHRRARRNLFWLGGIWAAYLAVLLAVSWQQPVRRTPPGSDRCFDEMCFGIIGAEELRGFSARGADPERLLRVSVRVSNHGRRHSESEAALRTHLLDADGRQWKEVPGLSGIRLTRSVPAGGTVVGEPVFRLPADATGLGLVFSHGGFSPSRLVIGDPESLGHRPEIMLLPPAATDHAARAVPRSEPAR